MHLVTSMNDNFHKHLILIVWSLLEHWNFGGVYTQFYVKINSFKNVRLGWKVYRTFSDVRQLIYLKQRFVTCVWSIVVFGVVQSVQLDKGPLIF